jgi:hypothetical protein
MITKQSAVATRISITFDAYDFWTGDWDGTDYSESERKYRREVCKQISELYNGAYWEYDVKSSGTGDEIYITMSDGSDVQEEAEATLARIASDVYNDQDLWVVEE